MTTIKLTQHEVDLMKISDGPARPAGHLGNIWRFQKPDDDKKWYVAYASTGGVSFAELIITRNPPKSRRKRQ